MKSIFIFIVLFSFQIALFSQVEIGVRVGTNIAKVKSKNGGSGNAVALLDVAIPVRFSVGNSFFLMPELHYIQKGRKLNFTNEFGDVYKGKYITNYIELPILFGYKYGDSEDFFTFYGGAGPFVGYAISNKIISNIGSGNKEKQKYEFDNSYAGDLSKDRRVDAGLNVGAGIGLLAGPGKVTFDLRMNFDMLDARKYQNGTPNGYQGTFNYGFGIGVGYNFIIE